MDAAAIADILKNRHQGERESTYAMLMQLVATNQLPECLHALETEKGFIKEQSSSCEARVAQVDRLDIDDDSTDYSTHRWF